MKQNKATSMGPRAPEKVYETAIFVPITLDSKLKRMLQEAERNHKGF